MIHDVCRALNKINLRQPNAIPYYMYFIVLTSYRGSQQNRRFTDSSCEEGTGLRRRSLNNGLHKLIICMHSNPSTFPTLFSLPHAAWREHAYGAALHGLGNPVKKCLGRQKWSCTKRNRSGSSAESLAAMLFAMFFVVE